jgi:hypothetical protein
MSATSETTSPTSKSTELDWKPLIFSKKSSDFRIESEPWENTEGLFGQIFLWVFETLPYLHEHRIFPDWKICAAHYGQVIPGALDLAYAIPPGPKRDIKLAQFRSHHRYLIGNDWQGLSALWNAYFRIPDRVLNRATAFGSLSDAIGVHYRGNDKHTASWDTNPVSPDSYLSIIRQFCRERPEFRRIFLATDDPNFFEFLKGNISLEVINLGAVGFHKDKGSDQQTEAKVDRAMLDCVLLSRCGVVLLTSSALSAFSKVINPDLEIYRIAASKLFHNTPYFPVAYIPVYNSASPDVAAIVDHFMTDDWTKTVDSHLFVGPFVYRRYWSPTLRLIYSYIRQLPGCDWVVHLPNLLAEYRRRRFRRPKARHRSPL